MYSLWEGLVVLKRTVLLLVVLLYVLSPWILCANWISFSIMVTCLACMAHKFVSSNNKTRYASAASCNAVTAAGNTLNTSPLCCMSCTISPTKWSKGALLISSSVVLWYLLMSHNATVPSLDLLGFLASVLGSLPPLCCCLLSLLPPFLLHSETMLVLLLYSFFLVCFVLAMLMTCVLMTE